MGIQVTANTQELTSYNSCCFSKDRGGQAGVALEKSGRDTVGQSTFNNLVFCKQITTYDPGNPAFPSGKGIRGQVKEVSTNKAYAKQ